jgi:hypothetical protein
MENINSYNQLEFEQQFRQTDLYQQLTATYDVINFKKFFEPGWERILTPRQRVAFSGMSAVPWYYFQYLNTDVTVYDLGCGCNFFKPYFKSLIGVGAESEPDQFFGDIHDFVDDEFYYSHQKYYQSVFSICALHFQPLENFNEICNNFSSIIADHGRGFLALNYQRLKERSVRFVNTTIAEDESWIREQLDNIACKILVLDLDLSCADAWLDGNIRIVFEQ